ncbi:hypothetical protein AB0A91_17970 [Streptomyces sp. NPDC042207]|uniref:hypothetical protein n=1 Tax=Streptomyces sp. NPDC042207 TaxID=3154331 RepID=UPI0033F95521
MTGTPGGPGAPTVIGVDAGSADLRGADHLAHHLVTRLGLPDTTVACTHPVRSGDRPHIAVSLALPDADTAASVWHRLVALLTETDDGRPSSGAALGALRHGPESYADGAALAAAEQHSRARGRAVVYPGAGRLVGTVPLSFLLQHTAIERVTVVGAPSGPGGGPAPATSVTTRDHVRPLWQDGQLVLPLVPAAGGLLAPFEVPDPTPCCADHG